MIPLKGVASVVGHGLHVIIGIGRPYDIKPRWESYSIALLFSGNTQPTGLLVVPVSVEMGRMEGCKNR